HRVGLHGQVLDSANLGVIYGYYPDRIRLAEVSRLEDGARLSKPGSRVYRLILPGGCPLPFPVGAEQREYRIGSSPKLQCGAPHYALCLKAGHRFSPFNLNQAAHERTCMCLTHASKLG